MKKFTFVGIVSFYATDISDAFNKIGNHFINIENDEVKDEIECPSKSNIGVMSNQEIIEQLEETIKYLKK